MKRNIENIDEDITILVENKKMVESVKAARDVN
jgi:hypothetical protein